MEKIYYVYILTSKKNGTLYTGVTNNLIRRIFEHKTGEGNSFPKRYSIQSLVYFESSTDIYSAISREKQIKNWKRAWEIALIEKENPSWRDLFEEILDP
jgi:putative endonuclease